MKFHRNSLCFLISVLSICPVLPQTAHEMATTVFLPVATPVLTALAIPPPVGPMLSATIGLMNVCANIFKPSPNDTKKDVEQKLTQVDLLQTQAAIVKEVNALGDHVTKESERVIRELTMTIETHEFFEKLRKSLNYLRRIYIDKLKVVINPKVVGTQKSNTFQDMLNYDSFFRRELRSFVSDFIKPNFDEVTSVKATELFFEHLLVHDKLLNMNEDDCSSDSLHNRLFKSFMYIIKVLSEAYTMAVSAHVIQYQDELRADKIAEAEATRDNAQGLIGEFKADISSLIEKTRWALNKAPRDIRNCGHFDLVEGKTFEHLSFANTLPKISYFEYIDVMYYNCLAEERFLNITDYDLGNCNLHEDIVPNGSQLEVPRELNPSDEKWPFSHMNVLEPDGTEKLLGHNKTTAAEVVVETYKNHMDCRTTFCPAYKKQFYAISTKRVSAMPGYVITGLRFQVRNRVVYIDIQQGKYLDMLTVDPDTVFWTETPKSNEIAYLGQKLKKIELGDFVLRNNSILTSIQLRKSFFRNGIIKVAIGGFIPPEMNNTVSYMNDELELHELTLEGADDPAAIGVSRKNIISKAPVIGKRYFVTFQPTGFEKDLGTHTIPYIDTREVASNPPAPLNGFELMHEAVKGYGGFIGIKLITPSLRDLVNYIQIENVIDGLFELN